MLKKKEKEFTQGDPMRSVCLINNQKKHINTRAVLARQPSDMCTISSTTVGELEGGYLGVC